MNILSLANASYKPAYANGSQMSKEKAKSSNDNSEIAKENTKYEFVKYEKEEAVSILDKKDETELSEQAEKEESESKEDIFQLSDKDRERLEKISERYSEFIMALHSYESSDSMFASFAESAKEKSEIDTKCMKIASNIAKGLNVQSKDEAYLSEHNTMMYQSAMMQRMMAEKEEDKEAKSVLDKENQKQSTSSSSSSGIAIEDRKESKALNAINDVLTGKAPLSSLDGVVDISSFDGVKSVSTNSSASTITTATGTDLPVSVNITV